MPKHPDWAWQWPPYQPFDPQARCPKCGYDTVQTTYYPEERLNPISDYSRGGYREPLSRPMPERLRRECVRCGHWWCEGTVGDGGGPDGGDGA